MPNMVKVEALLGMHPRDAAFLHPLPAADGSFSAPIIKANKRAADLLKYSMEELQTMSLTDIIGSHSIGEEFTQSLHLEGHAQCESIFTNKGGAPFPVAIDTHLIETSHEKLCLTTARDISETKNLEDALNKASAEIKVAKAAKHEFLSNMSHELRTPLNGFLGMTQILMGTELTATQREFLSLSQDAARRLTKLLTDLLSLSSVESGKLEAVHTTFEVYSTLDSLVAPLSRQAMEKSLTLSLDIAPNVPRSIRGDSSKLRQILINLLFNAIRFTNQGEVSLSVTLAADTEPSDNCKLLFAVEDSGIGIPAGKQESIFDSFTLSEDYMTKEYGGAGLGLAISKQLAKVMNGTLVVESIPGQGSKFTLCLPFQIAVHPSVNDTPPLSILLAEDEQVNSIMASRMLKKAGHSVTIVSNGQNAIDTLIKCHFDLILMDVQMPVINGMDVTRIIRRGAVEGVSKDLPIIGLTAYAADADRKRFMDAGMNSVVTKPFETADLIDAIGAATT